MITPDIARAYLRRGWWPIPVPHGKKFPQLSDWPSMRLSEREIPRHFGARDNIGVLLGEASGLADVDLDSKEAIALADKFLPSGAAIFGRRSKQHGQQTIFPGSIHPSENALSGPRKRSGSCLLMSLLAAGSSNSRNRISEL